MSHRGAANAVVAVVAILVTSGLAVRAVLSNPVPEDRSAMVAAEMAGRDAVAEKSPVSIAAPIPTPPTVTERTSTTPAPRPRVTTIETVPPVPETVPVTVAPVPVTVAPAAPSAAACIPICWERRPAPAVAPSWSVTQDGVTVTARIEPAAPQVGDTVTIFWTTNSAGAGFCCVTTVTGRGAVLYQSPQVPGASCPPPTSTSGSTTVVMDVAANYTITVGASTHYLCEGPPDMLPPGGAAGLSGTFWVNPPA